MGMSCRCCKKKCDSCVCSPCPAIKSELLNPSVDYGVVQSDPPDERTDVPEGPLLGPAPPYPFEFKVETTCGYPKARRTTDLLEGLCEDADNPTPECLHQYDLYECQANGPRMLRIGPHKDTTHFGISLGPQKILCSDESAEAGTEFAHCPEGYACVASLEEPGKSYCEYDQGSETCDDESDPCAEGYECLSGKCVKISEELTKEFLQHPIQAEFGLYPVKNEIPKGTCPGYEPPVECTDSLICKDRFECVRAEDPQDVHVKVPAAVSSICTDGYCAEVGVGYSCVPQHPAAQKPKVFPNSLDADGNSIVCTDDTQCENLTGLLGSECLSGDCFTPAYCEKRKKYCQPVRVLDPGYSYVQHSGVPTFLVPMDGLPHGPLPLLGHNTAEVRHDPLRRRNLGTDEHVGACFDLDLNRDPKLLFPELPCSEDLECEKLGGVGSRCLEEDAIDSNAKPLQNDFPDQICDDSTPCPDGYKCALGICEPICTDKLCRQQHGAGFYCNAEGDCQQRRCYVPPGECSPGCCNEIFGDPWLPNHEWRCEERGSRPLLTDTACPLGDDADNFCFEEHGTGYTCEFSDQVGADGNPLTFCQGPKQPNRDVGLGCFLSPLDGYTPKKLEVEGNRDEIIPRPIGELYGLYPAPCSPIGEPCEDGYTCVTDALNAIRRVLPSGVACTDEVCEQRYGPGFACDLLNFRLATPKRFYKTLEKRELPLSKTPCVRSIELDGSTGTWEVGKSIYQGESWDEAIAKGIITGGIDLDTDTPLIEYELQGDLTDFSQGSVAIKEFDTASESDDDAEATDVTKVMQRCPYGYTANEFGFCQAVATDSDGVPITKDYVLINPITDLIDDTPTIELSDSTGTWEIGDGIYQGDDWANASAKGEIVGGQKLNSESPIIEYKLYGNQDFIENEQLKQYDLASNADGLAAGTAEQVVTTGELMADYGPCSEYSPIGVDPAFVMNVPIGEYGGFDNLYEENCAWGNCTTCERMVTVDQEDKIGSNDRNSDFSRHLGYGACNNLICNTLDLPSSNSIDIDFVADPGQWECFDENFTRKELPANVVCTTDECHDRFGQTFDCDPDPDHHGCIHVTGPMECIDVFDTGTPTGRGVCTKEVGRCELECGGTPTTPTNGGLCDDYSNPCPDGFDCNSVTGVCDSQKKCPEGFECKENEVPITRLLVGEQSCDDDLCEEQFGPSFECNDQGFCSSVYTSCQLDSTAYFGVTTDYGGTNSTLPGEDGKAALGQHGIGLYNLDSRKIRTRLYLDYGYNTHYPFDKGHMNVELKPTGCPAFEEDKKARIWKGNAHRHAYPKVNTVTIGNQFPSAHDTRFDLAELDDFVTVGIGPYADKDNSRLASSAEPGGLVGLGDPPQENWDRDGDPPRHLNAEYNPTGDPKGFITGCDPAMRAPCSRNVCIEKEFEYLDHSSSSRVGVSNTNMDDWRQSNQSVFSHNNIPAGAVGGLIIDRLEVLPINYIFPAHYTSPSFWAYPAIFGAGWDGPYSFEGRLNSVESQTGAGFGWSENRIPPPPSTQDECAVNAYPGVNHFMIKGMESEVLVAIYYNSVIGRKAVRYDGPELAEAVHTNQFLPPPNGWLENIWQLGDIASPRDWERKQHIIELHGGAVQYSRYPQDNGGVPWENDEYTSRNVAEYTQIECFYHDECPKDPSLRAGQGRYSNTNWQEERWRCAGAYPSVYHGVCQQYKLPENVSPAGPKNSYLNRAFAYEAMDEKDYIEKYEDLIPYDRHWNRPQANRSNKIPDPTKTNLDKVPGCWFHGHNLCGYGGSNCNAPIPVEDNEGNTNVNYGCTQSQAGVSNECDYVIGDARFSDFNATFNIEKIGDVWCDSGPDGDEICVAKNPGCPKDYTCQRENDGCGKLGSYVCVPDNHIDYVQTCGDPPLPELKDDDPNKTCILLTKTPYEDPVPDSICGVLEDDGIPQDEANQQCVEEYSDGYTCIDRTFENPTGSEPATGCTDDGECGDGEFCNNGGPNPDSKCYEYRGAGVCKGPTITKDNCTDEICQEEFGPEFTCDKDGKCEGRNPCPGGYVCHQNEDGGTCQPAELDDTKLSKHLLDYWMQSIPFPSFSGDHDGNQQTWFKSTLDPYGEVTLKPWLNPHERDPKRKHEELNLSDRDEEGNLKAEPRTSNVIYPPLIYSGGTASEKGMNNHERATNQWWWEEPTHFKNPWYEKKVAGFMYGEYLAQLGISLEYHQYDLDWLGQTMMPPPGPHSTPDKFLIKHYNYGGENEGCCEEKFGKQGPGFGFYCPMDNDMMNNFPPFTHYNFRPMTNVREVYRQIDWRSRAWWEMWERNPTLAEENEFYEIGRNRMWHWMWDDAFYWGRTGQFPLEAKRSFTGAFGRMAMDTVELGIRFKNFMNQPTGSYHGRDGMLRYNIHPWAQLYNQHRITDSLLEVGRSFAEKQKLMSSFGVECGGQGVFKTVSPTIFERFGYNQTGNILFELEQQKGSQLAELINPRFVNYRPHTAIPPGTARHIKIGGPGAAWMVYYVNHEIAWYAPQCMQRKYAIVPQGTLNSRSSFLGPGYSTPSETLITREVSEFGARDKHGPSYQGCAEGELAARTRKTGTFFGQRARNTIIIPGNYHDHGVKPWRYLNPFISPVLTRRKTFPRPGQGDNYGVEDGRSGTVAEELFDIRDNPTGAALTNTYGDPVSFYEPWYVDSPFAAYRTNWGTAELGKVYGLSKWPRAPNNGRELPWSPAHQGKLYGDRECEYNKYYYFGGDGYFDPEDLRSEDVDLQNVDPDKGQFVFVQIMGLQDELRLPGLPYRFRFGMVGSSHAGYFHHYRSNGMMPTGGDGMGDRFYPAANPDTPHTYQDKDGNTHGKRMCAGDYSEGPCPDGYTCTSTGFGPTQHTCYRRFANLPPNQICPDADPGWRNYQSCLSPNEWLNDDGTDQHNNWEDHLNIFQRGVLDWKENMTSFNEHYFDVYDVPNKFTFPVSAFSPDVARDRIKPMYDGDEQAGTMSDDEYKNFSCGELLSTACMAGYWDDYKMDKGAYQFPDKEVGEDDGGTMFSMLKRTSNSNYTYSVPPFEPVNTPFPIAQMTDEFKNQCQCSQEDPPCDIDTHDGYARDTEKKFNCLKKGMPFTYKIRAFAKHLMDKHVSQESFLKKYYYAQTTRVRKVRNSYEAFPPGVTDTEDFITTKLLHQSHPELFQLTPTAPGVPPQSYVADPVTITNADGLGTLQGAATEVETALTDSDNTTFIVLDTGRPSSTTTGFGTPVPGVTTKHPLKDMRTIFQAQNPPPQINYDGETVDTVKPFCRSMRESGDWEPIQAQIIGTDGTVYTTVFTIADGNIGEITENTNDNIITTAGMRATINQWDAAELHITGGNSGQNQTYTVTFDGEDGIDGTRNQVLSTGNQFVTGDKVQYINNSGGNDVVGLTDGEFYFVGPGSVGNPENSIHLYPTLQDAIDDKYSQNSSARISIAAGGAGDHSLVRNAGNCYIYELSFAITTGQIAKAEVALILKRGDTTGFDVGGWLIAGPTPETNDMVPKGPAHYRFARYQRFPGEECADTYDKECSLGGSRPCGKAVDLNKAVTQSVVPIGNNFSRNNGVVGKGAYGGFMPNIHYVNEDMWFELAKWGIPIHDVAGGVDIESGTEAVSDWSLYYLANQYSRDGAKGDSGYLYGATEAAKITSLRDWRDKIISAEGSNITWPALYEKSTINVLYSGYLLSIPLLPDLPAFGYSYQGAVLGEYIPKHPTNNPYGTQIMWLSIGIDEVVNPQPLVEYVPVSEDKFGNSIDSPMSCAPDFFESEYSCAAEYYGSPNDPQGADRFCKDIAEVRFGIADGFCNPDNDPNSLLATCWLPVADTASEYCRIETGDASATCLNGECYHAVSLGECSDEVCESVYGEGFKCDVDRCIQAIPTRPNFVKEEYMCARALDQRTGFFSQDTNSCIRSSRYYAGEIADPCPTKGNDFFRMDPKIEHYAINDELADPIYQQQQDDRDRLGVTPFHWPWVLGELCVDWGSGPPRRDTGNMGMGIDERFGWHHRATKDIKGSLRGTSSAGGDVDENFLDSLSGSLTPGSLNDTVSTEEDFTFFETGTGTVRPTLSRVSKYYGDTPKQPEDQLLNTNPDIEEPEVMSRSVAYNQYPNTFEAVLYRSGVMSGYTNTGDMQFFSDFHRKRNDILQAQPPCDMWTGVYDFKWPMTPSTGTPPKDNAAGNLGQIELSTPAVPLPEEVSVGEGCTTERCVEAFGIGWFCNEDGLCQKFTKVNISEKPVITFRNGAKNIGTPKAQKLWFHIDNDGCSDYVEEPYLDPPKACTINPANPDDDCGEGYRCRKYNGLDGAFGCDSLDPNTAFCLPIKCDPEIANATQIEIKEKRKQLGYDHLVLQPSSNPELDGYAMCPTAHLDVPYWGPDMQIRSALMNRDLITKDECSRCTVKLPSEIPEIKIWQDVPCPDQDDQVCVEEFGTAIETACITQDPDTGEIFNEPLCQTTEFFTCPEDAPITRPCCSAGQRCLEVDVYGCRECFKTSLPTITIDSPEDQTDDLLGPDTRTRIDNIDCATITAMKPNTGNGSSCDDGDVGDNDCRNRLTDPEYSNFVAQYPDITEDDIFCDSDDCQFYPPCPDGYTCANNGCDPVPLGHVPRLSGSVDITATALAGSGSGLDEATSDKVVNYELVEVQFTITKVNSIIGDPNYGFPIDGTEIDFVDNDFDDGAGITWDTTQVPNSIYEIRAVSKDSAQGISTPDTIYVLVEN